MQFNAQSLLAALMSTSLLASVSAAPASISAAPAQSPNPLLGKRLERGEVDCQGSHSTNSPGIPKGSGFGWNVYIGQPIGLEEGKECGDNFLNYLRAQSGACATITSWECRPITDGEGGEAFGILATFDTNIFCGAGQVQKAIWDATSPQLQNQCANHGDSVSAQDAFGAITGTLQALGGFVAPVAIRAGA